MLTDKVIQNAKPKEKRWELKDTNGLVLDILPSGSKIWRYRYSKNYKDRKMTIGEYPLIGLKAAREMRDEARLKLRKGEDPANDKSAMTLNEVYQDYRKNKMIGTLSEHYIEQIDGCHKNHIAPYHGNTMMKNIKSQDILMVLREMEADGKFAQASRVKQIYGQLFRHAIILGQCEQNPTQALHGALKTKIESHYARITEPKEVGALMRAINGYTSIVVRNALLFHAYTFVRPGELRHAEWCEFDLEAAVWKIPAEKMKMRRTHLVPLSSQAQKIINQLRNISGEKRYVFPSPRTLDGNVPMSEATELAALRIMGYRKDQMCAHGFRGMASTLLHENGWGSEFIESQLAHEIENSVAKAYNYAKYLPKRTEMMQWWADYLDKLRDSV